MPISAVPEHERPLERLLRHGHRILPMPSCSRSFLRTGAKGTNALELERGLLARFEDLAVFAFVYNALREPSVAVVLYPLFGLLLSPMIAAVAMSLNSVSVVTNALRLNGVRLQMSNWLFTAPGLCHNGAHAAWAEWFHNGDRQV